MIELHYAPINLNETNQDIPIIKFRKFENLIKYVQAKTKNRRGEYVLLVAAHELDQVVIDESGVWLTSNILPLFAACKILFIFEFYSYEEAFKVALHMKETSELCYEPKKI